MPLAAELIQTPVDAEIMTQSPSQTVSIYEALAEILSKPTESLSYSDSKSTDRTLFSDAPISSTTTTTTTTTTSTTPRPPPTTEATDDLKVEHSTLVPIAQIVHTARVNNQQLSTQQNTSSENVTHLTTTSLAQIHLNTSQSSSEISMIPTEALTTLSMTTDKSQTKTLTDNEATEIMKIETNLIAEKNQSMNKQLKVNSTKILTSPTKARNKSVKTSSTVPPNYSPRFSDTNRIPILSFGSPGVVRKLEMVKSLPVIDLMTKKVTKSINDQISFTTPSVFPVYRPEIETTTIMSTFTSTLGAINFTSDSVTEITGTTTATSLPETVTFTSVAENLIDSGNSSKRKSSKVDTNEEVIERLKFDSKAKTEKISKVDKVGSRNIKVEAMTDLLEKTSTTKSSTLSRKLIDDINDLTTISSFAKAMTTSAHDDFESDSTTRFTTAPSITSDAPLTSIEDFSNPIEISTTSELSLETMTTKTTSTSPSQPSIPEYPKSFPVLPTQQPTESPQVSERVAYAILANKTVVRRVILERLTTENPYVIYGIFPNKTVIRKFRNGSIIPDENATRIEITNIDPESLTNPHSEFHQLQNVLTTILPITEQTKTVFHQQTYTYLLLAYR